MNRTTKLQIKGLITLLYTGFFQQWYCMGGGFIYLLNLKLKILLISKGIIFISPKLKKTNHFSMYGIIQGTLYQKISQIGKEMVTELHCFFVFFLFVFFSPKYLAETMGSKNHSLPLIQRDTRQLFADLVSIFSMNS